MRGLRRLWYQLVVSVMGYYINVYCLIGDGKTHYIKKQLQGARHSLVIAVNESFSPLNAILKLRSLTRDESCNIFFNFTIVPSIVSGYL